MLALHIHRREELIAARIGARVHVLEPAQLVGAVEPDLASDAIRLIAFQHVGARQQIGVELDLDASAGASSENRLRSIVRSHRVSHGTIVCW